MFNTKGILFQLKAVCIWMIFSTFITITSCKNSQKEKKHDESTEKKEVPAADINSFSYTVDSLSEEVAVLVIGPDGKSEYVIDKPDRIFQKTKSGLEYKYIISGKSKKYPKAGDVLSVNMDYKTEKDSLIFSSSDIEGEFKMRLTPPSHPGGSIEEAFSMLSEGDSAIFKIDAINFITQTQKKAHIPEYINPGDKLVFYIKMNKIVENKEFIKQNSETYSYYIDQEKSLIERFVLDIGYSRTVKKSGLSVITISKGTGKKVKEGNLVTINYTASFLDGTIFDSTIERNAPFRFVIGKDEVIEGLEEGVKDMNIGDHSIFIIPFRLAYGETRHGIIPPFSTLVFEVELLDAK